VGEPIERIEPWPSVEDPEYHIVVFTAADVWWSEHPPFAPGWLEVRVFDVMWEESYGEGNRNVGGMSFRTLPASEPFEMGGVSFVSVGGESMSWPAAPPPGPPVEMGFTYERAGAHSNMDRTRDWREADPVAEGSTKWDGCTNYSVHAHACSPEQIVAVAAAFHRGVELAHEIMRVDEI